MLVHQTDIEDTASMCHRSTSEQASHATDTRRRTLDRLDTTFPPSCREPNKREDDRAISANRSAAVCL